MQKKHPYLYFEFYEQGGKQSVLMDNWKAIKLDVRGNNPKPIELYNLSVDPSESQDMASDYPEIVAMMDSLMFISHTPLESMSLFDDGRESDMPF